MQYNFHNEKYSAGSIGGIHKEQFREYIDPNGYKNRVDPERTHLNLYKAMSNDGMDWRKRVRQAVEDTRQTTGRKVRSNTVVICSTIETVPKSWSPDVCKTYFQDKADWFQAYLNEKAGVSKECMLSIAVHLDEDSPHCTYAWIPMKDGKLQAKNIVDKKFLKAVMTDSEKFTLDWIEQYNLSHQEKLERLETHIEGGRKKHLQEQEFKIQKASEKIEQLEVKHEDLSQQVSDAEKKIAEVSERELSVLEREHEVTKREDTIAKVTASPSLNSYAEVKNENTELKKQLSLKDKIIENLKEQNTKLQQTLTSWKEKIQHLGRRMANALGFKVDELNAGSTLSEFPDRTVKEAYESSISVAQEINPRALRVLPDSQNSGQYVLAAKDQYGKYAVQESGFQTRELAEKRRKDLFTAKLNLDEKFEETISKHITR